MTPPPFAEWLQRVIPAGGTVLDVGCGDKWYWQYINAKMIGIDAWPAFSPDYLLNLEVDDLPDVKVDAVLMADFLEHMSKERGKEILEQAKQRANLVMVLTPLVWSANDRAFFDKKGNYYQDPFVFHKSLWGPADFPGFTQVAALCPGYFHGLWRA